MPSEFDLDYPNRVWLGKSAFIAVVVFSFLVGCSVILALVVAKR
jgi:hypothetical protein